MRACLFVVLFVTFAAACAARPEGVENARRVCSFVTACSLPAGMAGNSGGTCARALVNTLASASAPSPEATFGIQCARTSTTCTALRDCLLRAHGPAYCMASPGTTCDGNVLVTCPSADPTRTTPPWPSSTTDCALQGLQCRTIGSPGGGGGGALCATATACDPSSFTPRCDGTRMISCNGGGMFETATDCAHSGQVCEVINVDLGGMTRSVATCVPSTTACSVPRGGTQPDRCESNTLVECEVLNGLPPRPDGSREGRERRTDCAHAIREGYCGTLGAGSTTPTGACLTFDSRCAPDSPDRCNGNALEICVNGRYESTDCSTFGLRRCVQVSFNRATCAEATP